MKRNIQRLLMLTGIILGISWGAESQVYVRVRPALPQVRVYPIAPSPRHVWIEGNWIPRGRNYRWQDGYWAVQQRGQRWSKGYWQATRRGYVWVPGRWVRARGRY